MEQTTFNFDQQDNRLNLSAKGKDKLRQSEQHSRVYLINAPDGELITIAHRCQHLSNQQGKSYVE